MSLELSLTGLREFAEADLQDPQGCGPPFSTHLNTVFTHGF